MEVIISWPVYVSRYLSVHVSQGIALETTGNGFMEINHEMTYDTHCVDVCLANYCPVLVQVVQGYM